MILDAKTMGVDLDLDAGSLDPSVLSMGALMREINLRHKPPALLRYMMNALEKKRQQKLLGWSRPWNKTGMTVFRTHSHDIGSDCGFLGSAERAFWEVCRDIPFPFRPFAESLWSDPSRMAFTFYHNHEFEGREYEGLTFSLGRKLPGDRTKRDRIDFVLEDLRCEGRVDNRIDKIRIIVNPFDQWTGRNLWSIELTGAEITDGLHGLYSDAIEFYRLHRDNPERQWNHWAFRFIDYFGPRSFIPHGSAFT